MDYELLEEENGIGSEPINLFLQANTVPEHISLFNRAVQVLRDYNNDEFEDQLEALLFSSSADAYEPSDLIVNMDSLLKEGIVSILTQMNIKVDPEISLLRVVPILESLRMLEDTEDVDSILKVLDSGDQPVDQLIECLQIAGLGGATDYYSDIWNVDYETLINLRNLMLSRQTDRDSDFEDSPELTPEYQHTIKVIQAFNTYLKTDRTRFMNTIRNGIALNLPFDNYVTYFSDNFNELEDINVAVELLGFFYMSSDKGGDPTATIGNTVGVLVEGIERAQRVLNSIRHISSRFEASMSKELTK